MMQPHQQTPASYTVVGAGAIGGTLAFHLAEAGHYVCVVDADDRHARCIAEQGITVTRGESRRTVPVARSITVAENLQAPASRVLLAVKAQATEDAMRWVAPQLARDGFVVSLQNGLNEQLIAEHVGEGRTVGAFVNLFADVTAPGEIRDGGAGALVVGELDGRDSARVRSVVQDLQAWGPAQSTGNVHGYLWSKLGFGAMLVATALADAPMAELIDAHRHLMYRLAAEVYAVSSAEGVVLEPFDAYDPHPYAGDNANAKDDATDKLVAWLRTQAKDRSGIWRDIAVRHRPTEVPVHYTPVVGLARRHGLATHGVERLLRHISELEAGGAMSQERLHDVAGALS
jgi:2-dehydropantoate 2-reductase